MTVRLKPHVSTAVTDNGMAVLEETTGRFFELNATGATVLTALLDGACPQELAQRLTAGADTGVEQVSADIAAFVTCLTEQGLAEADTEADHGPDARTLRGDVA
ncbi:lasso peptide biosynthesis PqqD family chaperone [Streptomyces sp. NPDC048434]|uniref:lasso peptide biosynthesis PqqD family chaperone n=1 Tax=Streptomyces sp. NPDC048434 TaxID=3365549 RepID=UPI0037240B17